MSKWTLKRYAKFCKDCNDDAQSEYAELLNDDMLWADMAQSILDNDDDGLEEFIRVKLGAKDVRGCLMDDLAYPGNCKSYILKGG